MIIKTQQSLTQERRFSIKNPYKAENLFYLLAKHLAQCSPEARENVKVIFTVDEDEIKMEVGLYDTSCRTQ